MTDKQFIDIMNSGEPVEAGSPVFEKMHELSQQAIRLTMRLNTEYHTPEEIVALMSDEAFAPAQSGRSRQRWME